MEHKKEQGDNSTVSKEENTKKPWASPQIDAIDIIDTQSGGGNGGDGGSIGGVQLS